MVEAKGRNGYFKVDEVKVWSLKDGTMYVDIYSKRQGNAPPCRFIGPMDEMTELFRRIFHAALTAESTGHAQEIKLEGVKE